MSVAGATCLSRRLAGERDAYVPPALASAPNTPETSGSTSPLVFPSDAPPHALAGFDILQRLGAGGVGEVFLARSRAGKLVAIKTIADARRDGHEGETADAFAREASVCVRLRHPCIVQVRAFLEEPGFAALVFEYVPGVALARVLRFCQSNGVRMPDGPAWHVVERVLTALAYAHGFRDGDVPMPIVHRDVSPSNVLLDWSGGVKIADFGIAKVLGVSSGTRVGIVKGTLGCMSPEQARGEPVDERADVYAAALLAWRLATGRAPFGRQQKDEFEILRAMRQPRIPPLASIRPDLPEPLLAAVARALEPERERRTITAAELAEAVRAHVDVRAGWIALATLLESWKGALERTVKRAADTTESSGSRAAETIRYEEVALAFDDVDPDSPTFEAHALPSDPAMLAALPLVNEDPEAGSGSEPQSRRAPEEEERETAPALPTEELPTEEEELPQSKIPTVPPATPRRRGVSPVVVTFLAVFALAFGLAFLLSWR